MTKEAIKNYNSNELLNDMQENYKNVDEPSDEDSSNVDADGQEFYKLLEDAEQVLYPACINFTRSSFLV